MDRLLHPLKPKYALAAIEGHFSASKHLDRTILDFRPANGIQLVPQNTYPMVLRVWDTNKLVGLNSSIGYNEWHLCWFQHKLLKQLDIL